MDTITLSPEEYYALLKERDFYKVEYENLCDLNLKRSVEVARLRKLADEAVKELQKIYAMVNN